MSDADVSAKALARVERIAGAIRAELGVPHDWLAELIPSSRAPNESWLLPEDREFT
jgi:hypothetical protein